MRKHLIWMLALALALGSAGAASAVPNIQTITGRFSPKKLPKDKPAPISLFTDVSATNPGNPYQLPNPTTLAKVDYDKNGRYYQKGLPTCDPNQFTVATTTQQAKDTCRDSRIGGGSAKVAVPTGPSTPPLYVDAVVTAFNGANRTLVLFSYNEQSGAQTLVGKIAKADPGSPPTGAGPGYGITLTVPVPPLSGGTAVITEFNTKAKKIYRYKGKKRSLISARCGPAKKLKAQARFTDDQGQIAVATFSQRCKQKKEKHHS
jgi:hypothetical protein